MSVCSNASSSFISSLSVFVLLITLMMCQTFQTVLVMSLYILAVVGLIRKHLKKVEAEEEKILLITKEGITEVSAESLEEAEGEALL